MQVFAKTKSGLWVPKLIANERGAIHVGMGFGGFMPGPVVALPVAGISATIPAGELTVSSGYTPIFASGWDNATGTSDAAILDNGAFTSKNVTTTGLVTVVTGAIDNPFNTLLGGNALRVEFQASVGASVTVSGLTAPANGEHRYMRFYLYTDFATDAGSYGGGGNHGFWTHGPSNTDPDVLEALHWGWTNGSSAMSPFYFETYGGASKNWSPSVSLAQRTIYRVEIHLQKVSSTTYYMDIRLYDSAGTLLVDETGFTSGVDTLSGYLLASTSSAAWDAWTFGLNGISNWSSYNATPATPNYVYASKVLLRDDTWCGAFDGVH